MGDGERAGASVSVGSGAGPISLHPDAGSVASILSFGAALASSMVSVRGTIVKTHQRPSLRPQRALKWIRLDRKVARSHERRKVRAMVLLADDLGRLRHARVGNDRRGTIPAVRRRSRHARGGGRCGVRGRRHAGDVEGLSLKRARKFTEV
jgi:hypothetical protein